MNFAELKPPPGGRGKQKGVAAEGQKSEIRREGRMGAGNSAKQSADRGIPLGGFTTYCPMAQYS